MKNNLFVSQFDGVYEQMAKVFLMGFTWRWATADAQSSCSRPHVLCTVCCPQHPQDTSFASQSGPWAPVNQHFQPHGMQTHVCVEPWLFGEYETIDMETAGGGQIWQSRAVLPLNMTWGGKEGTVTHSTWTKAMSIPVVKVSSPAMTKIVFP